MHMPDLAATLADWAARGLGLTLMVDGRALRAERPRGPALCIVAAALAVVLLGNPFRHWPTSSFGC